MLLDRHRQLIEKGSYVRHRLGGCRDGRASGCVAGTSSAAFKETAARKCGPRGEAASTVSYRGVPSKAITAVPKHVARSGCFTSFTTTARNRRIR